MSEVIEIANPMWDVFSAPMVDKSTTEYEYVEYREKNVNVAGLSQYELVNQDLDLFILPSESYIQVKCTITNAAGAIIPGGEVALNNSGYSIFDKAFYYMNDQAIENLDYVGMLTHVKHICNGSKEHEQSLQQQGFALDRGVGGPADELTVFNTTQNATHQNIIVAQVAAAAGAVGQKGALSLTGPDVADNDVLSIRINGNPIHMKLSGVLDAGATNISVNNFLGVTANTTIKSAATAVSLMPTFFDSVTGKEVLFTINGHPCAVANGAAANGTIFFTALDGYTVVAGDRFGVVYKDDIDQNYVKGVPFSNSGFKSRRSMQFYADAATGYAKQFTLMLPLWKLFPLFEANRHVFRGVKHTIRLYKNQQLTDIILRSTNTPAVGNVNINYISWWVPICKPTIKVGLELDKQLAGGSHKVMAWNGSQMFKSNVFDPATTNGSYRITSTAHKPTRIIAFFQTQDRYNSQTKNSRLFDSLLVGANSGVTRAHIRVGSTQYPKDEYTCTFTTRALSANEDLGRLYSMYLSTCGFEKDSDKGAPISYEEFRDLYPMFVFDLSAQHEDIWTSVTSLDVEFRWQLAAAAPSQFVVWTFVEYQREVTLAGLNSRLSIKF